MKTVKLNDSSENMSLMQRRANQHRKNPTKAEACIIALLDELGEKHQFQRGIVTDRRFFIADFYFPKPRKLVLEVDGESHKRQVWYDAERTKFIIKKRRMRLIRITNEEAFTMTKERLSALLDEGSSQRISKRRMTPSAGERGNDE